MTQKIVLFFATAGFVSVLPHKIIPFKKYKGGGLLGSLVGWGLAWLWTGTGFSLWIATAALILFSVWISHRAEKIYGQHDDPRIVIDEVAGVWVAALLIPRAFGPMLAALLLFRVFDVWKGPWGNGAAKLPGGRGIVADDIVAGVIANVLVRVGMRFFFV